MRSLACCIAVPLSLVALAAGCASNFGPSSVRAERPNYNREIIQSQEEQMLLNLVRLRYRDTPMFVELTSVVTSYTFDRNLALGGRLNTVTPNDELTAGAGVTLGNRPTVTYLPLQGEEFATRMLSPLPLDSIMLFAQNGWSIERLLLLCVQRVNDVENAPSATGPTPALKPDYEKFAELASRLRRLSVAKLFGMNWEPGTGETTPPTRRPRFWLRAPADPADPLAPDVAAVRRLLDLDPNLEDFHLTQFPYHRQADEVGMRGRSLLGLLYYLAQSVEVPPEHAAAGLVTVTVDDQGRRFDWQTLLGETMHIRTSKQKPADAFVAVQHRGWWYYVADSDLTSKSSLNLLNFLFSLQSASGKGKSPILTLPVGG